MGVVLFTGTTKPGFFYVLWEWAILWPFKCNHIEIMRGLCSLSETHIHTSYMVGTCVLRINSGAEVLYFSGI